MIVYIIKSTICLLCFWAFYQFILEREKTLVFNRFYLLGTLILSFIIPIVTIEVATSSIGGISDQAVDFIFTENPDAFDHSSLSFSKIVSIIYLIITGFLFSRLIFNIYRINQKIKTASKVTLGEASLVLLDGLKLPHSFLDYIFLEKKAFERNEIEAALLLHELAHVKQKHSIDILIVEILRALFWFNPLLNLYRKSIQLNHEFLADQAVLEDRVNTVAYQKLLLSKVTGIAKMPELVSGINFLITKKRFEMMTKTTSKSLAIIKMTCSVILCSAMILAFSNKVAAQSSGASDELIQEYQDLMDKSVDENGQVYRVSKKDAVRMKEIYGMMSEAQRAENPNRIPPPPPPAPPAPPSPPSPPSAVAAPTPPTPPTPPTAPAPPTPPCKKEKAM